MRLHVGGTERKDGWTVLNVQPGPHVDIVGNCADLSELATASVEQIYASHVLEHLSYVGELPQALAEFWRVLRPGGQIMVSVPDLDALCQLFLHPRAKHQDRWEIMRMMFGGQTDAFDLHKVGFWADSLARLLFEAGFADMRRVESFGLFDDASTFRYRGVAISLNVEARKPEH